NLQKALATYGGAGGTGANDRPVQPKEVQVEELKTLIKEVKEFALEQEVRFSEFHDCEFFEHVAKIREAREALIYPDEVRRKFLTMAGRIERLFKHIGIDDRVHPFLADRDVIKAVAESIRANVPPA